MVVEDESGMIYVYVNIACLFNLIFLIKKIYHL